jgi:hypothetical protein
MPNGDPLIIGTSNTETNGTLLNDFSPDFGYAFDVESRHGSAVRAVAEDSFGMGVIGKNLGVSGSSDGNGVTGSGVNGSGVFGSSNRVGVYGASDSDAGVVGHSNNSNGVYGLSTNGNGVWGHSPLGAGLVGISGSNAGVHAHSQTGPAGRFHGDIDVSGKVFSGSKPFRIDHPLDPENKYLIHVAVESPQMKNVYDGVAELEDDGAAWVELPEYFEELNRDFCYQLSAIGAPAPSLYIAEEVSENRFKIAGGESGTKVSWQITGIRKDRWASANPIEVEQEKSDEERGRYLYPELYNEPEERGIRPPILNDLDPEEQRRQAEEQLRQMEEQRRQVEEQLRQRRTEGQEEAPY